MKRLILMIAATCFLFTGCVAMQTPTMPPMDTPTVAPENSDPEENPTELPTNGPPVTSTPVLDT